jgi:hypothetical protein
MPYTYHTPEPLPFYLGMAGKDTIDLRGIKSVGYTVEGLLHLERGAINIEWAVDRTTETVGLGGIRTDVEKFDYEELVVPLSLLAEVRLTGGIMRARRLRLRARRLDAFGGVPAAKPGRLIIKIRRRHWRIAKAMVAAIADAQYEGLEYTDPDALGEGDTDETY